MEENREYPTEENQNESEAQYPVLGKLSFDIFTRFLDGSVQLKPKEKQKYIQRYFDKIFFPDTNARKDAYLIMRLLMPQIDRERGTYGLKEANLGKIIGESLGLSKVDANRLYHFKNPQFHPKDAAYIGDFVLVMKSVVGPFCSPNSKLTLLEVDTFLDKLANCQEKSKALEFTQILRVCSAKDLEWICRIILKDLKIGITHEKILPMYNPASGDLFNRTYNLRKVCEDGVIIQATLDTPTSLTVVLYISSFSSR